jgi:dihydropteroate synthase
LTAGRPAEVAARHRIRLVCSHAGGLPPRTRPHRPAYRDVVAEVTAYVTYHAERAMVTGVSPSAILVDPAHDFGKNTWRRLGPRHIRHRRNTFITKGLLLHRVLKPS